MDFPLTGHRRKFISSNKHRNQFWGEAAVTKEVFLSKMQEEVLDTEDAISMDTRLEDVDWDSLAFVSFIAMANTSAGIKVDRAALKKATTVGELYNLLQ